MLRLDKFYRELVTLKEISQKKWLSDIIYNAIG